MHSQGNKNYVASLKASNFLQRPESKSNTIVTGEVWGGRGGGGMG